MHKEETYLIRLSSNNPAKTISEQQHCMSPVLLSPCADVPLNCTATLWVKKIKIDSREAQGWFVLNQCTEPQDSRVPEQSLCKGMTQGETKADLNAHKSIPWRLEMPTSPSCLH